MDDTKCPNCGWDALDDWEHSCHKILRKEHTYNDCGSSIDYVFEVKCPWCGTKFEYSDSSC